MTEIKEARKLKAERPEIPEAEVRQQEEEKRQFEEICKEEAPKKPGVILKFFNQFGVGRYWERLNEYYEWEEKMAKSAAAERGARETMRAIKSAAEVQVSTLKKKGAEIPGQIEASAKSADMKGGEVAPVVDLAVVREARLEAKAEEAQAELEKEIAAIEKRPYEKILHEELRDATVEDLQARIKKIEDQMRSQDVRWEEIEKGLRTGKLYLGDEIRREREEIQEMREWLTSEREILMKIQKDKLAPPKVEAPPEKVAPPEVVAPPKPEIKPPPFVFLEPEIVKAPEGLTPKEEEEWYRQGEIETAARLAKLKERLEALRAIGKAKRKADREKALQALIFLEPEMRPPEGLTPEEERAWLEKGQKESEAQLEKMTTALEKAREEYRKLKVENAFVVSEPEIKNKEEVAENPEKLVTVLETALHTNAAKEGRVLSLAERRAQDGVLRKLRNSLVGKAAAGLALLGSLIGFIRLTKAEGPPTREVVEKIVSQTEIGSPERMFFEEDPALTPIKWEMLRKAGLVEGKIVVDEAAGDVRIYLGTTSEEAKAVEEAVKVQPGSVEHEKMAGAKMIEEGSAQYLWGGRNFERAELEAGEREALISELGNALDKVLEQYGNIDLNTVLRRIEISGNAFSSPEGHKFPEKNLELSRKRAEVVGEIFRELLAERGIDVSKIDVRVEGKGARGDVLDLVKAVEGKIGKEFRQKTDEAKRNQAEGLIRLMNEGKWDFAIKKIQRITGENISEDDLRKIFEETIASQRRVDFQIVIEGKDLDLYTAKKPGLEVPVKVKAERVIKEIEVPGGMKIQIEIEKAVIPPTPKIVPPPQRAERIVVRRPKEAVVAGRQPVWKPKIPRGAPHEVGRREKRGAGKPRYVSRGR